jgi:hypothetical protein
MEPSSKLATLLKHLDGESKVPRGLKSRELKKELTPTAFF